MAAAGDLPRIEIASPGELRAWRAGDGGRQAKADGSWGLLDAVEALEVPPDLTAALDAAPPAAAEFAAFPRARS